jgi:uncharacterized membrane protein YfcA
VAASTLWSNARRIGIIAGNQSDYPVSIDIATILLALAGVFLIAFMKGAFGGGFAIVGIPLLSIVMSPLYAGALLAPLFVLMDICALRYWKPSTWSKPDLLILVPSLVVGIGVGYMALRLLDARAVAIVMALITLAFAGLWLRSGGQIVTRPRSTPKAVAAGLGSGITTMVAHSGGPPLAMYLLPLGMTKAAYAGTTSIFFTIGNALKAVPWLLLVKPIGSLWVLGALCLPAIPLGVWVGWKLHQRLDQQQLYRACYGLLVVTALKLLWDGVTGYIQ